MMYLVNAFSLQMLEDIPCTIKVCELEDVTLKDGLLKASIDGVCVYDDCPITSAIGHKDTAAVLGVPMNRVNISLKAQDTIIVAQLMGGRLPEGTTELPQGFKFKFLEVSII